MFYIKLLKLHLFSYLSLTCSGSSSACSWSNFTNKYTFMWSCGARWFRWWCHPSASLLVLTDLLNVVHNAGGRLVLNTHVLLRYFVRAVSCGQWLVVDSSRRSLSFVQKPAECVSLVNTAAPSTAESGL